MRIIGHISTLSPVVLPSVTHLSLTAARDQMPLICYPAFPALQQLTLDELAPHRSSKALPAAALLAGAPRSLAHVACWSQDPLSAALVAALPATVRTLAFDWPDPADLRVVLGRWFSGQAVAEVGRLERVVLRRRTEGEFERRWPDEWREFRARLAGAGCKVQFV